MAPFRPSEIASAARTDDCEVQVFEADTAICQVRSEPHCSAGNRGRDEGFKVSRYGAMKEETSSMSQSSLHQHR